MLRYPLRLKLGAFAALLFFTAALVVVGLVSWRQESLAQSVGGDAAWHAYKLDRDTVQLRNYLNLPDRHLEGLRLRFELLYSRLPLLRSHDIIELMATMPVGVELVDEIEDHMDRLDQFIRGLEDLDSDSLVLLDNQLREMAEHTERLVIAINGHLADSATRERQQLQQLYGLLLVLILAMSLAALMVVVILFREGRDNAIARRTLETLSRELEVSARQAQSASQAKSDFLATVSHEIRTPLNGVIGMSDLLLDQTLEARARHYAKTIHESADQLLVLINDLLDFSKIEAGRLELEVSPLALDELIEGVVALFRPRAEARGVELVSEISEDLPSRILSDPGRLRQVLLNLLSNAVKFTEHGRVRLVVGREGEAVLRFDVIDSGCGITTEALSRLFEPFQQGDASTARHFGGTGLGLAISRRLVEAMGGRLQVESRSGVGSHFWFTLPLVEAPALSTLIQATDVSPRSISLDGASLLVVEDNPVNQQVAAAMLERLGCRVRIAASGEAALRMVTQQRFDLIFMDIQMPDLDGLEVTRCLRARGGWAAQIPIVAMTAGGGGGEQARCLAVGMNGYLTKPLFTDALAAVLRRHLTSSGASAFPVVTDRWSIVGAEHPLDHTTLEALRESLGDAGLETLVALYRQQAQQRLEELDAAIEAGDRDEVIHLAHQIKGESSSLGAVKMAGLATRLEQLGRHRQLENASLVRRQLLTCLSATLSALESSPSDGTATGRG